MAMDKALSPVAHESRESRQVRSSHQATLTTSTFDSPPCTVCEEANALPAPMIWQSFSNCHGACMDCAREAVIANSARYVRKGCMGLQDLLDLGLPEHVVSLMMAGIVASKLAQVIDRSRLIACHETSCVGSYIMEPGTPSASCLCCNKLYNFSAIDGMDLWLLEKLATGVLGSQNSSIDGLHRECPECAVPVEKGKLCPKLTCTNCQLEWDILDYGKVPGMDYPITKIPPQFYVPKAVGLLAKAGFYGPLEGYPKIAGSTMTYDQANSYATAFKVKLATLRARLERGEDASFSTAPQPECIA